MLEKGYPPLSDPDQGNRKGPPHPTAPPLPLPYYESGTRIRGMMKRPRLCIVGAALAPALALSPRLWERPGVGTLLI